MEAWLTNESFQKIGVVEGYSSFIWTERFDVPGDFELQFPLKRRDRTLVDLFAKDRCIQMPDSDYTMIIEDHNIETDEEDGNFFTVTGRSYESILDRRVIWPQVVFDGLLQDALETLADTHISNNTSVPVARRIPRFRFQTTTDTDITGLTLSGQYTGQTLLEVFEEVCAANEIGFRCVWDGTWMNLEIFPGGNLSETRPNPADPYVIFSPEFDNLLASEYATSKRELKTVAYTAGEGEGSLRSYYSASVSSATGLDRREMFVDARDLSRTTDDGEMGLTEYNNVLKQRGLEKLSNQIELVAMSGEAETSFLYTYGEDFNLGDIVQLTNEYGFSGQARVSEFIRTHDSSGIRTYPTFVAIE